MEKNAVFIVVHLVSPSKVLLGLNNMFSKNKQSQSGVAYCVLAVLGFPIGFAPHCQEALLKTWYHVDVEPATSFEAGVVPISNVLIATDSEGEGDILLQSDSDQENLVATPTCSDGELLLETESEKECSQPPQKRLVDTQINGLQTTS